MMVFQNKRYINFTLLATTRRLPRLAEAVLILTVSLWADPGVALAGKAAVGGLTGGAGRASQAPSRSSSGLEKLMTKYYLAPEQDRIRVLDEIRQLETKEALEFTLDLLRYPDIKVRREAMDTLKRWGAPGYLAVFRGMEDPEIGWLCESIFVELGAGTTPFLKAQLENEDPLSRGRAAYLLGRTKDPQSAGPLYGHLKDPDREVRIQVIQALSELGDERSLKGIFDLFEMEDVGLTDFVLQAAEKFGPRAAEPLQAALKVGSVRVRSGAALALGRLRLPQTLPHLLTALTDREAAVRRSAVKALDTFHDMSAAGGLFRALGDNDLEVQEYATSALARLYPEIYPQLMKRVQDQDPDIRKNVISTFRKIGDRDAVPAIIAALDDPDANVRMFAVAALIEFKDPRAIHGLIERMQNEDEMGWLISYAFLEIGESAVEELLRATGDDRFCLTRNLVILQMGDTALTTLHERARNKRNTNLRYNAIALLGELGRPESVPVLQDLLQYGEVGWVAANALASMGKPAWGALRQSASIEGIAGDNARHAISKLKDPDLLPDLVETLDADDAGLRRAVSGPLVQIGGPAVMLVSEKMSRLEGPKFSDAAEILCRIQDKRAIEPINKILFPEPWEPVFLSPDQLFDLKHQYARKGSLQPVLARLKKETGGAGGGGGPWERVAP